MSGRRVSRVLCAADPRGSAEAVARLADVGAEQDIHAIALVGDLGAGNGVEGFREVFRALGRIGLPAYWVPGPGDAPVADYLREAHNTEIVFPVLRGVHGTAALTPDEHVLVAGFGGAVSDDPDAERDEVGRLHYPRWEPEYRLKIIREFDELETVLLFATPPAHKGHGTSGSEALAELVATYRPRLVVTGGERTTELIGRSLVVAPGSLEEGHYALADLHAHTAVLTDLRARA